MNDINEVLGKKNEKEPRLNDVRSMGKLDKTDLHLKDNKLMYKNEDLEKKVHDTMDKYNFSNNVLLETVMAEISNYLIDIGSLSDKMQTSALADLLTLEVKYNPNLANEENPDSLRVSMSELSDNELRSFIKEIQPLKNKYAAMVNFSYGDNKPFRREGQTRPIKKDFRQGTNSHHLNNGNRYNNNNRNNNDRQQFQRSYPDNKLGVYFDADSTKSERMTKEVLDKMKYALPVAASILGIVSTAVLINKNMRELQYKRWD